MHEESERKKNENKSVYIYNDDCCVYTAKQDRYTGIAEPMSCADEKKIHTHTFASWDRARNMTRQNIINAQKPKSTNFNKNCISQAHKRRTKEGERRKKKGPKMGMLV